MSTQKFTLKGSKSYIDKDPEAQLDYAFLWSSWLEAGETIDTQVCVIESGTGVVYSSYVHQGNSVIAWVRGGTVGEVMTLRCRIATSAGRFDDRSVFIKVKQQ